MRSGSRANPSEKSSSRQSVLWLNVWAWILCLAILTFFIPVSFPAEEARGSLCRGSRLKDSRMDKRPWTPGPLHFLSHQAVEALYHRSPLPLGDESTGLFCEGGVAFCPSLSSLNVCTSVPLGSVVGVAQRSAGKRCKRFPQVDSRLSRLRVGGPLECCSSPQGHVTLPRDWIRREKAVPPWSLAREARFQAAHSVLEPGEQPPF